MVVRGLSLLLRRAPLAAAPAQRCRAFSSGVAADVSDARPPPPTGWMGRGDADAAAGAAAPPLEGPTPAQADETAGFAMGESVTFWRTWEPPALEHLLERGPAALPDLAANLLQAARSEIATPDDALHYAYHAARAAFFAAQGAAGLAASALDAAGPSPHPVTGASLLSPRGAAQAARLLAESAAMFRQDRAAIRRGDYAAPWDMDPRCRQFNPAWVGARGVDFVREAVATLRRRRAGSPDAVWLDSPLYPEYYRATWHYQTDGWLSSRSARVYDNSTETLFVGRQDAMQRATLMPLLAHLRGRGGGGDGAGLRLLDAACGTGRFGTFVRDNLPGAHLTLLDLSPFYLQEARDIHQHWEELRGGGGGGGGVAFVQAAAERMPAADGAFDGVTCVYLFHELPRAQRAAVAAELGRVLAPGGVLVLTDSIQLGDRPAADAGLGRFGDFNEPHYREYVREDLAALFREACPALRPWRKEVASSSKVLAWVKDGTAAAPSGPA